MLDDLRRRVRNNQPDTEGVEMVFPSVRTKGRDVPSNWLNGLSSDNGRRKYECCAQTARERASGYQESVSCLNGSALFHVERLFSIGHGRFQERLAL
jgi:hypothetical protein